MRSRPNPVYSINPISGVRTAAVNSLELISHTHIPQGLNMAVLRVANSAVKNHKKSMKRLGITDLFTYL